MNTIRKQYSADGVNWVNFELVGLPQYFERTEITMPDGSIVVSDERMVKAPQLEATGQYALFIFDHYYPRGGMDDLALTGTLEECREKLDRQRTHNRAYTGWGYQIVDLGTFTVIEDGGQ